MCKLSRVIVSMSGGKDSTATALLALEQCVDAQFVFADTGNEHPETYAYIDYLEDTLGIDITRVKGDFSEQLRNKKEMIARKWIEDGVPQEKIDRALKACEPTGNPFLDLCLWRSRFPNTLRRFCTEHLKVVPQREQVILPALREYGIGNVECWVGVRADESAARAKLTEREQDETGAIIVRPILHWSVNDVFAMHKKHGIKPNPLYTQGMSRVGCMPCVNICKNDLREIATRFPDQIDRIAEWEQLVQDVNKGGHPTFLRLRGKGVDMLSDEEYAEQASIHGRVEWSKTKHGGRKKLDMPDEPPQCTSVYGLCE